MVRCDITLENCLYNRVVSLLFFTLEPSKPCVNRQQLRMLTILEPFFRKKYSLTFTIERGGLKRVGTF